MYEHSTYEVILQRMLDKVTNHVDKRSGSIIYDALAPAAVELAQMYMELDINLNLSYADTASGQYLERRTAEFGIHRRQATKSQRKGVFYGSGDVLIDIAAGTRFSIQQLNFVAQSKLATGHWILECETAGVAGNQAFGTLLPIDYVEGLARGELTEVLIPGEDAEEDEVLRQRYLTAINEQPFGGNISDYRAKISTISGVGGTKVFPVWNGGGTVKVTVIASNYGSPSSTLIEEVQTLIDPAANSGDGHGFAPIGHKVTVTGAQNVSIDLSAKLTLAAGITLGQVQSEVEESINAYLLSLRQSWANESTLIVRISQLESRILTVPGVLDITNTLLNGATVNVSLSDEGIPVPGVVALNE